MYDSWRKRDTALCDCQSIECSSGMIFVNDIFLKLIDYEFFIYFIEDLNITIIYESIKGILLSNLFPSSNHFWKDVRY